MSQPRPRVLFVGNFFLAGSGRYAVCQALSSRLREHGWTVLTTSVRQGRIGKLADMVSAVARWRHDYDVAHVDVFSGPAFVWAEAVCLALRVAGKPYVLTLHGGLLPEFAVRHPRRVRRLLAGAAAVTAPSRFLQERLASFRPDLRLHPNPLDIGRFSFRLRTAPAPALVWVRAFHGMYNPTLAIDVLARLRQHFPEARLTMAGPDKGDGSLQRTREAARLARVDDVVTYAGSLAPGEVAAALDRHDIFLNTSNVDNTPVSVLEALATGLPAVSTRAGGIPFLLEDERDALLVPVGDADAMADAVRRILTDRHLPARLSTNARATAERSDWAAVLPLWEQLLVAVASPALLARRPTFNRTAANP